METEIRDVKFKGKPAKGLFINVAKGIDLWEDTETTTRLAYVNNHLYLETKTVGINPEKEVQPVLTRELISSNIVCESWDKFLNQ